MNVHLIAVLYLVIHRFLYILFIFTYIIYVFLIFRFIYFYICFLAGYLCELVILGVQALSPCLVSGFYIFFSPFFFFTRGS